MVTLATFLVCGSPLPFSTPAALSSSRAAGGVLVTKVNERSSYTEISTGHDLPALRLGGRVVLPCRTP